MHRIDHVEPQLDVNEVKAMRGRPWTGSTRAHLLAAKIGVPDFEANDSTIETNNGVAIKQSIASSDTSVLRGFANVQGEWE